MKPSEWNTALAPDVPAVEAYKVIGREVRTYLTDCLPAHDMIGTTALVEQLYPAAFAAISDEGQAARARFFKALTDRALGKYELKDCLTRGTPMRIGFAGKMGRPYLWHAPKEAPKVCEACGQELRP